MAHGTELELDIFRQITNIANYYGFGYSAVVLVFPIFCWYATISGNIRKGTSEIPKRTSVSRELFQFLWHLCFSNIFRHNIELFLTILRLKSFSSLLFFYFFV